LIKESQLTAEYKRLENNEYVAILRVMGGNHYTYRVKAKSNYYGSG